MNLWGIPWYGAGATPPLRVLGPGWNDNNSAYWQQADTGDQQVALFSEDASQPLAENPWVIGNVSGAPNGYAYVYNGSGFQRVSRPHGIFNTTYLPQYLTDHHAIASLSGYNSVWHWNGTIQGQSPASGPDWTIVIGDTPNAPLAQIAFASKMAGSNWCGGLPIGPSRLWALDTAGNIYLAYDVPPVNNGK